MARKKNYGKAKHDLFDECVSVNECTGLVQKIKPDAEELKKFNREYNKK